MPDGTGALSRRRLLGAGAVAGATALASGMATPSGAAAGAAGAGARAGAGAGGPAGALSPAGMSESKFYAGITLVAGNELTNPTSLVFVKDPFNGSYAGTPNGYVGASLDVPAGSVVNDVAFYLYQQTATQVLNVQLYHPGATGFEILLDHTPTATGLVVVSTAAQSDRLPRLVTADDALTAFVWHGLQSNVCRGIRVDYTPPPGGVPAASTGGLVVITPARLYDSRQYGGKLQPNEQRVVSTVSSPTGSAVVPAGATAVTLTLTVTDTEGAGGYVAAFPAGATWAGTSSINWFGPGQNLATTAVVALGGAGDFVLQGGANATHVVVDVTAYMR